MNPAILIFSHSVSPRLHYVVDFISQYYGVSIKLIYDQEKYLNAPQGCYINYSYHRLRADEIFIHSHALLFESSVRPVKIECFESDGFKAFFKTEGDAGFDIFAAIFYLISRYEEYLPHKKDAYGRYGYENSVASKEDFLHLPLVNIWLENFKKLLGERMLQSAKPAEFAFVPTYDIDMAWTFRNKGFKRNLGSLILLLMKLKFGQALHRLRVVRKKRDDPYDAYEWMDQLHRHHNLNPVYFFLVAGEISRYDRNIDIDNPDFISLVQETAQKYRVGLHPSWVSGDRPVLISQEKRTLEKMTGGSVKLSRQHYIRMDLPSTFQNLIAAGITNDYSMGYGSINGFRASVAAPFYWYDLKQEKTTGLLVHPFCFMDANAYYEQHLSAEQAFEELMKLYTVVKSVEGTMITIWHNSFLGTDAQFDGWRESYSRFIKTISSTP